MIRAPCRPTALCPERSTSSTSPTSKPAPKEALATVNPVPYYVAGGENAWAGVKGHLNAVTERAATPSWPSTPACWPLQDIEVFTLTTTSRSCSRCAWTAGPADRSAPDHHPRPGRPARAPGADPAGRHPLTGGRMRPGRRAHPHSRPAGAGRACPGQRDRPMAGRAPGPPGEPRARRPSLSHNFSGGQWLFAQSADYGSQLIKKPNARPSAASNDREATGPPHPEIPSPAASGHARRNV